MSFVALHARSRRDRQCAAPPNGLPSAPPLTAAYADILRVNRIYKAVNIQHKQRSSCAVTSHFQDTGFLGSVFGLPLWPVLDFTSLSRASAKASSSSYLMHSIQ